VIPCGTVVDGICSGVGSCTSRSSRSAGTAVVVVSPASPAPAAGTVVEVVDTPATSDPAGSPQAATSTSRAHPRARRFVMSWFPLNAVCTYDARGAVAGSRHTTDSGRVSVKVLHPPAWS
jgi:hypothetical protein